MISKLDIQPEVYIPLLFSGAQRKGMGIRLRRTAYFEPLMSGWSGGLVASSCGVAARRAKPQARRAESEARRAKLEAMGGKINL